MIVLETDRLYLREWVPDDWVRFKPLVADPRVIRYVHQGGPWDDERTEQRVREYIQYGLTRGWQLWPVICRDDSRLIGTCGFSDGFPPDVEIGWRLLPDCWGSGFATEAARATLDYGFRTWNFPRVIAVADPANPASIRVMEKIGMIYDGTLEYQGLEVVRFAIENPRGGSRAALESLSCRRAADVDAPLLAQMNQQLVEDESSRNPMSLAELETRMRNWLANDWQAAMVEDDTEPVGYLLFQSRSDEYRPEDATVYVRQFFIARDRRGRGIGRQAFDLAAELFFSDATTVVLDVLEANPRARRFWESLGFAPYGTTMKLSR